ncbi:hypothetical protein [Paenibacillus sp. CECT 9249]|uniref:hypothetical protein n=1 Tax=Paenibacillus sp. CECT 9249 TaxID=2845385 RepID=UPI001E30D04A|nr:hypothetical protein [Paenibacillus sp. CECT 9249]
MMKLRKTIIALAGALLLAGLMSSGQGHPSVSHAAESGRMGAIAEPGLSTDGATLNQRISDWIGRLAEHEEFAAWKQAEYQVYPLGPGMHGWLVLLTKGAEDVGYLVVSATETGEPILSEYGTGSQSLFSMNTLYSSLVQHELIPSSVLPEQFEQWDRISIDRYYIHPMLAVWKVGISGEPNRYVDAKTGQILTIGDDEWRAQLSKFQNDPTAGIAGSVWQPQPSVSAAEAFDPYYRIVWITHEPLDVSNPKQLLDWFADNVKMTYVSEWYDEAYLVPVALTGYQIWDGITTYVGFDQEGNRYVPFETLSRYGSFYEN